MVPLGVARLDGQRERPRVAAHRPLGDLEHELR
jgi:hypothetical protein